MKAVGLVADQFDMPFGEEDAEYESQSSKYQVQSVTQRGTVYSDKEKDPTKITGKECKKQRKFKNKY